MASKQRKQRLIHLGNPEHLLSESEARTVLKERFLYEPNPEIRGDYDPEVDSYRVHTDLMRVDPVQLKLQYDVPEDVKGVNQVTEFVANKVIDRLQGPNKEFTKFTVEALDTISEPMLEEITANPNPAIDEAISALPKSNGKTFTSVQTLRVANEVLNGKDLEGSRYLAANRSFARKSDLKASEESLGLVAVRGRDVFKETIAEVEASGRPAARYAEDNPYEKLSDEQQDFVTAIYRDATEKLDKILDVYKDESTVVEVVKPKEVGAALKASVASEEPKLDFDGLEDKDMKL